MQDLINAIKGIPFGPPAALARGDDTCPYRGLEVFDVADAEFFFGRDRDVQRLVERLKDARLLTVIGPSGSGKSSLVRAGLIPALRRGAVAGVDEWKVCLLRPGAAPLTALAAAVTELSGDRAMGRTLDDLAEDPRTLHLAVEYATRMAHGCRVLLVIDQLEEVFTLCHDDAERQQLFANVLYASGAPGGATVVVLTMRADFYPRCAAYPELAQIVATHQFLASPMDAAELRQAIEEPARSVGLEFEEGLVAAILDDVGEDPAALPLLEHALLELWKRRRGRMLTLEGYIETGGVSGALAKRADAVFAQFSESERQLARQVLLRLTQPGEGTEDTRRRATLEELASSGDSDSFDAVLTRLVDARLLTTGVDRGERSVDVAHEALIRGWPKLRGWIESDRAGLRVHRRLTDAVAEWQRLARDESVLYRGVRLDEALEWAQSSSHDLNDLERAFLDASQALRDRERQEAQERHDRELRDARAHAAVQRRARQRMQWLAAALFAGVLVAGVAAVVALHQRATANAHRALAEARSLAVASAQQLPRDPELALLLAAEAARRARTPEVEDALRGALQSPIKVSLRGSTQAIIDIEFSPDGRRAVAIDDGGGARVWNLRTATAKALADRDGPARTASFSPDGRMVLTSGGRELHLWNATTGRADGAPLTGHTEQVLGAEFSHDGQRVLSWSEDGRVLLWDVPSRRRLHVLTRTLSARAEDRQQGPFALHAALSHDGRRVATASLRALELWDAASGRRLWRRAGGFDQVGFDARGERVITTDSEFFRRRPAVRLWSVGSGRRLQRMVPHREDDAVALDAEFVADGRRVLTAGTLWDPRGGHVQRINAVPQNEYGEYYTNGRDISFEGASPDGQRITSIERDRTEVRDAATGRRLSVLQAGTSLITALGLAPDGRAVLTGHEDGNIELWDPRMTQLVTSDSLLGPVAVSRDGRQVAALTDRGVLRIWSAATGRPVGRLTKRLPRCSHPTFCGATIRFSPDGRRLQIVIGNVPVEVALDGDVRVHKQFALDSLNGSVALSGDGRRVGVCSFGEPCRVHDVATGRELSRINPANPGIAFSVNGKLVATYSATGVGVVFWDATTGDRRANIDTTLNDMVEPFERAVEFSDDETRAILAQDDGTAAIHATNGGRRVALVAGHRGSVVHAGFSHDGRFVTTLGANDTTRVSDAASGRLIADLGIAGDAAMTRDNRHVAVVDDRLALIVSCEACSPWSQLVERAEARTPRELTESELRRYLGRSGA